MALAPVKPKEALTTLKVVPSDIVQTTGESMTPSEVERPPTGTEPPVRVDPEADLGNTIPICAWV